MASYVFPFAGQYAITQGFGGAGGHPGVDFAMPVGTPLYAISNGTVVQVGGDPTGYGNNYIVVQAANGIRYWYGHGSAAFVHVGQQITQGQLVGLSGNEGDSTGPHLHFGMSVNGQGIDPESFLQSQGAVQISGGGTVAPGMSAAMQSGSGPTWEDSSIAAALGLSQSLFNSIPELKDIMAEADANGWTPDTAVGQAKFKAALQDTQWWKTHTDQQRKWETLSQTDPAEARQQFVSSLGSVIHTAASMGIALTNNQEWELASQNAQFAWTDDELKYSIAAHFKMNSTGMYGGDAGKIADDIYQKASDYGMPMNPTAVGYTVAQILQGKATQEDYVNNMKNYAMGMFPSIKEQLMAGQTVRQVAQPYLQVLQNTLEIPSDSIDLTKETTLKKALSYVPPIDNSVANSHKQTPGPQLMPLWQYEQTLKDDPRWLKTDNAQQSLVGATVQAVKDLGLSA